MKPFLQVFLGTIGLACTLGLCLDVVTANVAVEYFTVHHPRVVDSRSPWVMALIWGIGASWWFGAIAGAALAWINHRRTQPLAPRRILKEVAIACAVLWCVMISILVAIYLFAGTIPEEIRRPSFESDRRIMAVALAHQFEYLLGGIALVIVGVRLWRARAGAGVLS